ncbi:MAG: hypothetical protein J6S63_08850 [Atopobiaceae bacterium]|nr:hypothetical protein [Atopobiaceae bacterium]
MSTLIAYAVELANKKRRQWITSESGIVHVHLLILKCGSSARSGYAW